MTRTTLEELYMHSLDELYIHTEVYLKQQNKDNAHHLNRM